MIIIKHLSGPLKDQAQSFNNSKTEIRFGRRDECDVVFPPDLTVVAREHFAIVRKPSGSWVFDSYDRSVFSNGNPLDNGDKVESGATLELGRRGGPSFQFLLEKLADDDLPRTELQEEVVGVRSLTRRNRRTLSFTFVAFAALAIAVAADMIFDRLAHNQVVTQLRSAMEAEYNLAATRFDEKLRKRMADSAYLVVLRDLNGLERGIGTAWPVGKSTFATNAHVAEAVREIGAGSMQLRAPGTREESYRVIGQSVHPSYRRFQEFLSMISPQIASFGGGSEQLRFSSGYDVALLRIESEIANEKVLDLASQEELSKLSPGEPIAMAGYPLENIVGGSVQTVEASPTLQLGNITSITDFFMLPPEREQRLLIQHNLPATGGASGSPIFSSSGKVIGILSGGNVIVTSQGGKQVRIPNAALINHGQSINLVSELIGPKIDPEKDLDYWKRQASLFSGNFDPIAARLSKEILAESHPLLVGKTDYMLTNDSRTSGSPSRVRSHRVHFEPGIERVFLVLTNHPDGVEGCLLLDGKPVQSIQKGRYFAVSHQVAAPADGILTVSGPEMNIAYQIREYTSSKNSEGNVSAVSRQ